MKVFNEEILKDIKELNSLAAKLYQDIDKSLYEIFREGDYIEFDFPIQAEIHLAQRFNVEVEGICMDDGYLIVEGEGERYDWEDVTTASKIELYSLLAEHKDKIKNSEE